MYSLRQTQQQLLLQSAYLCRRSITSTTRIIATQDLPNGKAYRGDVLDVKAGYARNMLIPQRMAVYATHENFLKYGIDPNSNKKQQQVDAAAADALSNKDDSDLRASDLLKKYLRNKVVCIVGVVSVVAMVAMVHVFLKVLSL